MARLCDNDLLCKRAVKRALGMCRTCGGNSGNTTRARASVPTASPEIQNLVKENDTTVLVLKPSTAVPYSLKIGAVAARKAGVGRQYAIESHTSEQNSEIVRFMAAHPFHKSIIDVDATVEANKPKSEAGETESSNVDLSKMKKAELVTIAAESGIDTADMTKAQIIQQLEVKA